MLPRTTTRVLFGCLTLLLLLAVGCGASSQAASAPGALPAPPVGPAQDSYPVPPPQPTHDPYAGPPPPPQPTHDPYVGPPDPVPPQPSPTPEPPPPPDSTPMPTLRPTQTFTPVPGVTETAPADPGISPTVLTPATPAATTPTPIGAVTATPGVPTPIPSPDEYPEPELLPTVWRAPTPDHAAILISTAVAREQASAAASTAPVDRGNGLRYGGFVGVTAVLLAGIGYAALLRRQRSRDRADLWQDQHPDE